MPIPIENCAIPGEHVAAVVRGLDESFGVSTADQITDLTERPGSNRAFQILVQGRAYLLRINTRRGDVARQFTCMRVAAEAGLAPRVWYTNDEDRISITDFIFASPFSARETLRHLPVALRILHALPLFPTAPFNTTCTFLLNKSPLLDRFLEKLKAATALPERERTEVLRQYERIVACYSPEAADVVSSHNDLFKPDNILYDGNRPWLVDWEASFPNDRYADLAAVANMLATNEEDERLFLQAYFAASPTAYHLARLHIMRQLAHMFYAMAFLAGDTAEQMDVENEPAFSYSYFQQRFWARGFSLADERSKAAFSRIHWHELLHNLRQPRWEEALLTTSNRPLETDN